MPCFSETKMIAAAWNGIDLPMRTPRSALIFSIAIWFACAISRSVDSIFSSMIRRARDTACREMPSRLAMDILEEPLRRILQNSNCFSFVGRSICQHMYVDYIKISCRDYGASLHG